LPDTSLFAVSAQTSKETLKLSLNETIDRAIKEGETHSYQIKLAAGQFFRAEVIQPNANVEVKFFGADGKEINAVFNFGAFAAAHLFFEAETAGDYRLEIAAAKTIAPNARSSAGNENGTFKV
jgi:hypothetical protein